MTLAFFTGEHGATEQRLWIKPWGFRSSPCPDEPWHLGPPVTLLFRAGEAAANLYDRSNSTEVWCSLLSSSGRHSWPPGCSPPCCDSGTHTPAPLWLNPPLGPCGCLPSGRQEEGTGTRPPALHHSLPVIIHHEMRWCNAPNTRHTVKKTIL